MKILRFGPNEIDLESYELRRAGQRLPISKTPLNLLILLVERPGKLITREEIAAALWTNPESIDVESAINQAINRIRSVLNDKGDSRRYIETAVGKGYRFIGPVERIEKPTPRSLSLPLEEPERNRASPTSAFAPAQVVDLNGNPGSVSADANPLPVEASFRTRPTRGGSRRVFWLGTISLSGLLALSIFWSLHRISSNSAATFEASQVTTNESENRVTAGAISPSGNLLVYSDPNGLFLRVLKTGATQPLKLPSGVRVVRIVWFPDDLHVLLSLFNPQGERFQLWTASIDGADAVMVRDNAQNGTPSPDGTRLAFTSDDGSNIWTSGMGGEKPTLFLKGRRDEHFPFIFWADGGKRLSYQRRRFQVRSAKQENRDLDGGDLWEYGSNDVVTRKEVSLVRNFRFDSAFAVAGGRVVYSQSHPPNTVALWGIWEMDTDEKTGAPRSSPKQLASLHEALASGLSVSGDGTQIAAVWERGQPDVYFADLQQPGPTLVNVRKLTQDSKNDFPHAWTKDSQSIIFESDREGDYHLFRQRLERHTAERLTGTQGQQVFAQMAPDGNTVLYALLPERTPTSIDQLYRVGLNGESPTEVPLSRPLDEFRCPLFSSACVLRERTEHEHFVFSELDPIKGKGRELARLSLIQDHFTDWALSPDGKTAAIPEAKPPKIRLVPLDAARSGRRESELQIQGIELLWSVNFSADGTGWFGEARRAGNSYLVYIDSAGQTHVLRETVYNTWGVPSPDGKKLAFVDYTADRNVWIWRKG